MDRWDIVVEFEDDSREVIQGVTQAQQLALLRVFDRTALAVEAIEYDDKHDATGERNPVNL